jgi:hypothetical protein
MLTSHRTIARRDRPGDPAPPRAVRARVWRVLVRGIGYASVGWLLAAVTPPADSAPIAAAGRGVEEQPRPNTGAACRASVDALAVAAASTEVWR